MIQIQRQENSAVTDYYLDVIARMFDGEEVYDASHSLEECKKTDIIIAPTATEFFRVYRHGFKKIVYWMQGIDGEESYLKHKSRIRKFILDFFTKFALKRAKAVFFVSEEMKRYEEEKFRLKLDDKSFIMPCFNVSEETGLFFDEEKYDKNVFAYVGSLSKWQCFSEIVDFYKRIEEKYDDTFLRVFTFEKEAAKQILKEKGIEKYSVDTVPPEKMTEALRMVKFGFVLRENIAVNNVATPTKLSSYLSAGVIPIYSSCLVDFHKNTENMKYVIPVEESFEIPERLDEFIKNKLVCDAISAEYTALFDTYYNPMHYIESYRERLQALFTK